MADQKEEEKMQDILLKASLDPDFWLEKFKDVGATTVMGLEICGEESFSSLEMFPRTALEAKLIKKFLGMDYKQLTTEEDKISKILKQSGLDPNYWLQHFKTVGVTTPEMLMYCDSESYESLSMFAKNPLQKSALRRFLHTQPDYPAHEDITTDNHPHQLNENGDQNDDMRPFSKLEPIKCTDLPSFLSFLKELLHQYPAEADESILKITEDLAAAVNMVCFNHLKEEDYISLLLVTLLLPLEYDIQTRSFKCSPSVEQLTILQKNVNQAINFLNSKIISSLQKQAYLFLQTLNTNGLDVTSEKSVTVSKHLKYLMFKFEELDSSIDKTLARHKLDGQSGYNVQQLVQELKRIAYQPDYPAHEDITTDNHPHQLNENGDQNDDMRPFSKLEPIKCTDLPSFLSFLKELLHLYPAEADESILKITEDLVAAVNMVCFNHLKEEDYISLLLVTLLLPLEYDIHTRSFKCSPSVEQLTILQKNVNEAINFLNSKIITSLQKQAYLFLQALSTNSPDIKSEKSVTVSKHLKYLMFKLEDIDSSIDKTLARHKLDGQSGYNVQQLIQELKRIAYQSNYPAHEDITTDNHPHQLNENGDQNDDMRPFSKLEPIKCTDLPSFLSFLKELLHLYPAEADESILKITEDLVAAVNMVCFNHLKEEDYISLLLVTLLLPLEYDIHTRSFKCSPSVEQLTILQKNVNEAINFLNSKIITSLQKQAYLFLQALSTNSPDIKSEKSVTVSKHLKYLMFKLEDIDSSIDKTLARHKLDGQSGYNVQQLIQELKRIAYQSNYPAHEDITTDNHPHQLNENGDQNDDVRPISKLEPIKCTDLPSFLSFLKELLHQYPAEANESILKITEDLAAAVNMVCFNHLKEEDYISLLLVTLLLPLEYDIQTRSFKCSPSVEQLTILQKNVNEAINFLNSKIITSLQKQAYLFLQALSTNSPDIKSEKSVTVSKHLKYLMFKLEDIDSSIDKTLARHKLDGQSGYNVQQLIQELKRIAYQSNYPAHEDITTDNHPHQLNENGDQNDDVRPISKLEPIKCTDLPSFLSFLKELLHQYPAEANESILKITEDLAAAVNMVCFNHLKEEDYISLLLVTLLLPLEYDIQTRSFKCSPSVEQLTILQKNVNEAINFLNSKIITSLQKQAYLFLQALSTNSPDIKSEKSVTVSKHLKYLMFKLEDIDSSIDKTLARHKLDGQSGYNVQQLVQELKRIANQPDNPAHEDITTDNHPHQLNENGDQNDDKRPFSKLEPIKCTDLPSFLSFLKELLHQYPAEANESILKITEDLAAAVNMVCFNHLKEEDYISLLLVTLLLPLEYDIQTRSFKCSPSVEQLTILQENVNEAIIFLNSDNITFVQKQAYLFLQTLNSNGPDMKSEKCAIVREHLEYLMLKFENLDSSIDKIQARYLKFEYNIHQLERELKGIVEPKKSEIQKDTYESFLELMNFKETFLSKKLTIQDALTINESMLDDFNHTFDPHQLLFLILEKIKMSNLKGRNVLLRNQINTDSTGKQRNHEIVHDDCSDTSEEEEEHEILIHPMDSLLALLHCCDNFLRQDLYQKLNTAQLAVPLLLRNPHTGEIEFPLWSMRSIVKQWKCQKSETTVDSHEGRIVDCETPLISFMRFSHPGTYSKSFILNKVMSCVSQSVHHFFFNQECEGSSVERKFTNGTVEACWYLPSGEKSDVFNDVITFANLRGNVSDWECEKQFAFLSVNSYMLFIFLNAPDIITSSECLKKLNLAKGKVLFLMNNCSDYEGELKLLVPKCDIINLSKLKEPAAIVIKIQSKIISRLSKATLRLPFCKLSNSLITCKLDINVDEQLQECQEGKMLAESIMADISKIPESSKVKEKVVPLQGPKLWHKWASLDTQQNRMKSDEMGITKLETFTSQKEKEKESIRHLQLEKMKKENCSPVMAKFIHVLLNNQREVRAFFLQWLKFFLDDQSSKILPDLQKKCNFAREKLRNKSITDESDLKRIRDELQQHDQELINASFGVEHIFRELGQMYECAMELQKSAGPDLVKEVKTLCKVAAHLLLSGFPLEIIDGDAAHVPLKWVTGILDNVKILSSTNKSKQAKVAVLSVLGIQSTGKSTLLNTLFGIRFAVSAGRCTRGAFFQLLPVKSIAAECDYMLIIDTEGLRAPELDYQQTTQHDNELAALVIGLAGATIINISGEVAADMNDILQTSVHAFLRMTNVELKPSCQFVRHHVVNVAANKSSEGNQKFQQSLDDMTVLAAKAENLSGKFKFFSDVIAFDNKKDVQNFPNLWLGNPPMAPVNPAYCEAALQLKSKFIRLAESPDFLCSIHDFSSRISKLWGAVLKENFLFNFKNALEVEAFANLDAKYGKWSWRLQKLMLQWEAETRLSITPNSLSAERIKTEQIQKLIAKIDDEYDAIIVDLKQFFENAPTSLSQIMVQWRTKYEKKLEDLRQDHTKSAHRFCYEIIEKHSVKSKLELMKKSERDRISKHLKDTVVKMKLGIENQNGKEITAKEITNIQLRFDEEWDKWMKDLQVNYPIKSDFDFSSSIISCIRSSCNLDAYDKLIRTEIMDRPLEQRGNSLQLVVLDQERHLNFGIIDKMRQTTHVFIDKLTNQQFSSPTAAAITRAKQMTSELLVELKKYLKEDGISYDDKHIIIIVQTLMQQIKDFENIQRDFNFTNQYRVDIILEAAAYALRIFTQIQKESIQNHPVTYLASLRSPFKTKFSALCNATAQEHASAKCLIDLVVNQIKPVLMESLSILLADDVRNNNSMFASKHLLKGQVLLKMLSKGDFNLYSVYLKNISQSYLYWIKQYVEEHCKMDSNGEWKVVQLANKEFTTIMTKVTDAADKANQSTSIQWLTAFHTHLRGVILIDEQELHSMIDLKEDNDLNFFTSEFKKRIEQCKQQYLLSFKTPEESVELNMTCLIEKATVIVRDSIAGCCEQCPFCKEQCERSDNEHKGMDHFCSLHRPQCLGGYKRNTSQEMVLKTCTEMVDSDWLFRCGATNGKYVQYKKYREIYPDWEIASEARVIAPYWKWFIAKYIGDIVKLFDYKQAPLDEDWTKLRENDAENDIKKRYKLN